MTITVNNDQLADQARQWWKTGIIDIAPGKISIKGRPIETMIGNVGYAGMVWTMLRDDEATPVQLLLLEAALVAAVDHGPQAPSIAIARMSMTCGVSLNGAMASAINVLDDIHGGAGEQCLSLFKSVQQVSDWQSDIPCAVKQVLANQAAAGRPIVPGYGHRFHSVDPRAVRLLELVDQAVASGWINGQYAAIGREVEAQLEARVGKKVPMNIDGATAVIYGELGFEPALARGLFILSRSVGILAHAWEQKQQGGRIKGPLPPSLGYTYTGLGRSESLASPLQ